MADGIFQKEFAKTITLVSFQRMTEGGVLLRVREIHDVADSRHFEFTAAEWREIERKLQIAK
jgi:hypothetical protein